MNRPSLHALSLWSVVLFSLLFFSCDDSDAQRELLRRADAAGVAPRVSMYALLLSRLQIEGRDEEDL